MLNKLKHLREMEEIGEPIWIAIDQAQLDEYKKDGPREITLGDIDYTITKYFLDDNKVPSLELVAKKSRTVCTILLSMIWQDYQNYSTLDINGRDELRRKYFL